MPESNPMLRIIAPYRRELDLRKKERSSFRNHRFFCLLHAMHRTAAANNFVVLISGAHARPLYRIAVFFFCLSIRTHAPHARDVLAQSYVTLPSRNSKCVRITGICAKYIYSRFARQEAICLDMYC